MVLKVNRRKFVKNSVQLGLAASTVGYWAPSTAAESIVKEIPQAVATQTVPTIKVSVRANGRIPALYRTKL